MCRQKVSILDICRALQKSQADCEEQVIILAALQKEKLNEMKIAAKNNFAARSTTTISGSVTGSGSRDAPITLDEPVADTKLSSVTAWTTEQVHFNITV